MEPEIIKRFLNDGTEHVWIMQDGTKLVGELTNINKTTLEVTSSRFGEAFFDIEDVIRVFQSQTKR